jgi:hypothetical protein
VDNIGSTGLYYSANRGDQVIGAKGAYPETLASIRNTNGSTDSLIARIPPAMSSIPPLPQTNGANDPDIGLIAFTVAEGGHGYAPGQLLTLTGGTFTTAAQITVGSNGNVQDSDTVISNDGRYTPGFALPTNPIALAGGTSACKIVAFWGPTAQRQAIMALHYGIDGFIYTLVKDKYAGQATPISYGRVMRLSPLTGELTSWSMKREEDPPTYQYTHVPYSCCYFDGFLYVSTFPDSATDIATMRVTNGSVAHIELEVGHLGACMAIYNGRLWYGTGEWGTGTPLFSSLWTRAPGAYDPGSSTQWFPVMNGSGGTAAIGNYFTSMAVFNGALYVQFYNPGSAAKVYKIVADDIDDPTSTSFTVTTALATMNGLPHYLFADAGVLYAIGSNGGASSTSAFVTTDGATWVEKTASLPAAPNNNSMRPIFFGINQS